MTLPVQLIALTSPSIAPHAPEQDTYLVLDNFGGMLGSAWRETVRKTNLERLLARRPEGIFANPFERGEIGPDLFRAACRMGLEGIVSKRRDRPYRAGRSPDWRKIKNRQHPAISRVADSFA